MSIKNLFGENTFQLKCGTLEATSTSTGGLIVGGGVGIAKNLYVGGTLSVGTYVAGAAPDSIGYITIKDSAGNDRKVMVQA